MCGICYPPNTNASNWDVNDRNEIADILSQHLEYFQRNKSMPHNGPNFPEIIFKHIREDLNIVSKPINYEYMSSSTLTLLPPLTTRSFSISTQSYAL